MFMSMLFHTQLRQMHESIYISNFIFFKHLKPHPEIRLVVNQLQIIYLCVCREMEREHNRYVKTYSYFIHYHSINHFHNGSLGTSCYAGVSEFSDERYHV